MYCLLPCPITRHKVLIFTLTILVANFLGSKIQLVCIIVPKLIVVFHQRVGPDCKEVLRPRFAINHLCYQQTFALGEKGGLPAQMQYGFGMERSQSVLGDPRVVEVLLQGEIYHQYRKASLEK